MSRLDRRAAPITAGVIALLCALPPFLSSSWLLVMFLSFVWLVITANYDVLDGFLGHVNLGQGAFFGLGAYVATILLNVPSVQQLGALAPLLVTACALVVAALFAAVMAFPLFRLKGLYFAVKFARKKSIAITRVLDEGVIADEHLQLLTYAESPEEIWDTIIRFHGQSPTCK